MVESSNVLKLFLSKDLLHYIEKILKKSRTPNLYHNMINIPVARPFNFRQTTLDMSVLKNHSLMKANDNFSQNTFQLPSNIGESICLRFF